MGRQWLAVTGCVPRGRRKSRTGVFLDGLVRQRDTAGGRAYTEECFLVGQWYVCVYLRLDHATVDGKQRVGSVGGHPGQRRPALYLLWARGPALCLDQFAGLGTRRGVLEASGGCRAALSTYCATYRLGCPQLDVVLLTLYQHFDSAGRAPVLGHLTLPPSFGRAAYATSMADRPGKYRHCLPARVATTVVHWSTTLQLVALRKAAGLDVFADSLSGGALHRCAASPRWHTAGCRRVWKRTGEYAASSLFLATAGVLVRRSGHDGLALNSAWLGPLMFRRYVFIAVVPLFIHASLWGTLAMSRPRRLAYALAMLLLAGAYWLQMPRETWTVHSHEDWRSAVRTISADSASAAWPVLVRAGLIEDHQLDDRSSPAFREYCSFPGARPLFVGRSSRTDRAIA